MRQSSVLQTPQKALYPWTTVPPFLQFFKPFSWVVWGGHFLWGRMRGTPTTIFNFCCFIYFVAIITCKLLVDRLVIKTAWGMYLALYWCWGVAISFISIVNVTHKLQLVDHLKIKTAWGMYFALYWCWGAIFAFTFLRIRTNNNNNFN